MSSLKPVTVVKSLVEHLNDRDCYEIIEYLLSGSIIEKPATIYRIEALIKRTADFERASI